MEEGEGFLDVLEALRDAARRVETGEARGPALQALLALEAGADDLLSPGDYPSLSPLRRLLSRLRALSYSAEADPHPRRGGVVGALREGCRRCAARRALARVAGAIAAEIQAWIDRETVARLVAALRRTDAAGAARARSLLARLEARLLSAAGAGRFDPRLQRALLRHGVFPAVEARLGDPDPDSGVGDGCAGAVLALVRFNKDVFVGPVLMGPGVGALVASAAASPAPLRALNGLVAAIRSPMVDELHARGDLPRLVAPLCAPDPRVRVLALDLALRVGYYGRREVVDALLAEGLVKRLLCLQRSDLGGSLADTDSDEKPDAPKGGGSCCLPVPERESNERPFVSAVARFAVQVQVGEGLSQREKRQTKLEILRRVREAAVSPAEEATVLTEVLWGATP